MYWRLIIKHNNTPGKFNLKNTWNKLTLNVIES